MREVVVHCPKRGARIAERCAVAERFRDRLRGLIGRRRFEAGEAMLLPRCNDIHMWFMSVPIDVAFLRPRGGSFEITSIREGLAPWRLLPVHDWRATETLELPSGTLRRCGLRPGDELCIS